MIGENGLLKQLSTALLERLVRSSPLAEQRPCLTNRNPIRGRRLRKTPLARAPSPSPRNNIPLFSGSSRNLWVVRRAVGRRNVKPALGGSRVL
jgi:hypothetical protein